MLHRTQRALCVSGAYILVNATHKFSPAEVALAHILYAGQRVATCVLAVDFHSTLSLKYAREWLDCIRIWPLVRARASKHEPRRAWPLLHRPLTSTGPLSGPWETYMRQAVQEDCSPLSQKLQPVRWAPALGGRDGMAVVFNGQIARGGLLRVRGGGLQQGCRLACRKQHWHEGL